MKNKIDLLVIFLIILFTNQIAYSKPNIVVTIAPIASLVAMLTKDKADVVILDKSGGCPHHHSAKPSDKSLVDKAEMIIYIDDNFDKIIRNVYTRKIVYIKDGDEIIFNSLNECSEYLDFCLSSLIKNCKSNNIMTHEIYYKEDYDNGARKGKSIDKKKKELIVENIKTFELLEFGSMIEASKSLNINRKTIEKCVAKNTIYKKTYIFKLKNNTQNG